uniref:TF-B3 domain-containing protein n=1 Tax=Leersia perrieri TaxID=77586 RepID=A0A0D9V990_9ORYZ
MVELITVLKIEQEENNADSHGEERADVHEEKTEKSRPMPTLPSFFKIMVGYFSETMDIPLPFAKTITDLTGSNVYLEDAFGLRWRVRLCLCDGILSFGHGWKNFVLDHDISIGEFLVFRLIARSVFTVQIFAISACERMHHCERNKRQNKKRKPSKKIDYPANNQMVKVSNKDVDKRRKKQRTEQGYDPSPSQPELPVHVCIDSGSDLRCYESSVKELLDVAAGESHEVVEVPTGAANDCRTECNATVMTADKESIRSHQDRPMQLYCTLGLEDRNAATEECEDSKMLDNAELRTPLATMDLNEASIDDIFLSADIYEFDSDLCSPEAFSVYLNNEGLAKNGQSSVDCFGMPETSTCLENKQMSDVPITSADADSVAVAVHGIDINVFPTLPSSVLSEIGQDNSSSYIDADAYKKCKYVLCLPSEGNQVSQKGNCSVKQDFLEDGPHQTAAQIMPGRPKTWELPDVRKDRSQSGNNCEAQESRSTKSCVFLAAAANNKKFCITVPPPDQTWLELPRRLPVLPRTKKQARKILILKDPSMRLWPVLYQCTPKFNGFITGWADISRENNLHQGDTCEFELCSKTELSFQVVAPNSQ